MTPGPSQAAPHKVLWENVLSHKVEEYKRQV